MRNLDRLLGISWNNTDVHSKLVHVIERLMEQEGIKDVAELAKLSDMNQPTLHRILSGEIKEPRADTLKPLAAFFRVSVGQLRGDDFYAPANPEVRLSSKAVKLARKWDNLPASLQKPVADLIEALSEQPQEISKVSK